MPAAEAPGLLLVLALLLALVPAFRALAERVRQPAVVGELGAGIALASVLPVLPGGLAAGLLLDTAVGLARSVGELGLLLFLFDTACVLGNEREHSVNRRVLGAGFITFLLPFLCVAVWACGFWTRTVRRATAARWPSSCSSPRLCRSPRYPCWPAF